MTAVRPVVLAAALLCACARWFPAPEPMRSVAWPAAAPGPAAQPHARCLVVFLPGLGDDAEDFERNGFVADMKHRGLSVDMVAAQATLGYYTHGTFPERLAKDVVEPARARGYPQVWLIGMSLGGMGTLYYARSRAAGVTGLLALAPYLGERDVIDEIDEQGGLAGWVAPARADALTPGNYQREIWRWLQAMARGQERGPDLYLGFGASDKLKREDALLADALPDDHVYLLPGAHDWKTWRQLFDQFLQGSDFARGCR